MANFGVAELRLVAPREGWPNEKARAAASGATHVFERIRLYGTLDEAVADLNFVLATTARTRDIPKRVRGPREAALDLRARAERGERIGILFGRERTGLTNEEIGYADEIVTFPVDPRFASLNVAQSVLLMCYEWLMSGLAPGLLPTRAPLRERSAPPADRRDLLNLFAHLETALDRVGYFRSEAKRPVQVSNLRALLTRPGFSEPEVKVLRGVVAALERYARDGNDG